MLTNGVPHPMNGAQRKRARWAPRAQYRTTLKPANAKAVAKAARKAAKKVIDSEIETKMFEIQPATPFASVSTTAIASYLLPAPGTLTPQRVGRSFRPIRLVAHMLLHNGVSNLATDDSHNAFRVSVVRTDSGILPSSITYGIGTPLDTFAKGVKEVIYDKEFLLDSPGRDSTGYMTVQRWIDIDVPLNFKCILADDGTSLNTVYNVWMVSDSALSPSPGITAGFLRWFYKDA